MAKSNKLSGSKGGIFDITVAYQKPVEKVIKLKAEELVAKPIKLRVKQRFVRTLST